MPIFQFYIEQKEYYWSEQLFTNHGSHVAMVADFASHPDNTVADVFFLAKKTKKQAAGKPWK